MQTILQQIHTAYKRTGWSMDELRRRSGLKTDRSNLRRKLIGKIALRTSEAEALAGALGITLAWVPPARGAA